MKARVKDIFREIRKSIGRFLSILLIVAAGVGFFVGVKATAPSMYLTANNYFGRQHLMDAEILSTVGFSDEDVEKIREIEHIDRVMPSYSADLLCKMGDSAQVIKVLALPDDETDGINMPILQEGRLPQADDECVAVTTGSTARSALLELGQTVTFEPTAGDTVVADVLQHDSFTVVGLVELPQYFSFDYGTSSIGNGSVSAVVLAPRANFLYPRYTEAYVTLDCYENGISAFDEAYDAVLEQVRGELEALGDVQYAAFIRESEGQLDDAEDEFNESKADAEKQLDDALDQLNDAKQQIDDGLKALEEGRKELDLRSAEAAQQLADAEAQIQGLKNTIAAGEAELAKGRREYEAGLREANAGRKKLDEGWAAYNAGKAQYDRYAGQYQQYVDGKQQYQEALDEYNQALEYYNAANAALTEAENRLQGITDGSISVTDEDVNLLRQGLEYARQRLEAAKGELAGMDPSSPEYAEQQQLISSLEGEVAYYEARLQEIETQKEISKQDLTAEVARLRGTLDDAKKQLDDAKKQLDDAKKQLDDAEAKYGDLLGQMADAERQLNEAKAELDAGEAELAEKTKPLADAKKKLDDGEAQLASARAQVADAERQLEEGKKEAETQLKDGEKLLDDSEKQLDDALKDYSKGLKEYNDAAAKAEEELDSGMNRIQNARNDLREIVSGKWYVFSRDDITVNYSNFKMDAMRINAIADVFPVFFLLVAALVCLTTMSRMIDEQRTQMGTYQALGYRPREIASKYLTYAALACIGGCIVGPILCVQVLPRVIFGAYGVMYVLPKLELTMPLDMLGVSVAVALLCTVLVAWIACWKELRTTTAALMRPKAPKAGKKILLERLPFIWKHFSFFQKLTARNLFRYKVRLLMTVTGIAGCMALVVAGFGLNNAIAPIVELQYSEIEHDDAVITLDQGYYYEEVSDTLQTLKEDERVEACLLASQKDCKVFSADGKKTLSDTYLYIPQSTEDLQPLLTMRDPQTKRAVPLTDEGVVVTGKLHTELGIDIGDDVTVMVGEEKYTLRVTGVSECYLFNYVYITPACYQQATGHVADYNSIYVALNGDKATQDAFSEDVLQNFDHVILLFFTDQTSGSMTDTLSSMRLVVIVMILCAGILAFIVLYNLTNINLSERMREIATVKVLGFNHAETNMYIFRENVIMSLLGVVVGCGLGYLMAQYLISTVEVSMVTFVHEIRLSSYLYSAAITLGFTVLVNLFTTKKIREISMVESLKAIE